MYNIPYFKAVDHNDVMRFMKAHPFAMLVGTADNVPVATQVPFLFEERNSKLFLKGHMMRNTDHHKAMMQNDAVLCVFAGAHTYVSATLYDNKQTASTWNYMSVHARGAIKFVDNESLLKILRDTTNYYENDPNSPSNFENLPGDYVEKLATAIVGFEIEVKSLEHVFKLSQNKKEQEYSNIINHLSKAEGGEKIIADEMQRRKAGLFPSDNSPS